MNEVVTVGGCSADQFATTALFDRADEHFASFVQYFKVQLTAQCDIVGDDEDLAWRQFVARRCFAKLIPVYSTVNNAGPFRLFCDDLRPTKMLIIDPKTLHIMAVFDFKFANAMPTQFIYDVPWWLLLQPPAVWLRDDEMEEFVRLFKPRKDQFTRAMERVEAWMRDSWDSRRFWFNLASQ